MMYYNPLPCCYLLSGVNLLIGTDNDLMLLDRSGQGKGNRDNRLLTQLLLLKGTINCTCILLLSFMIIALGIVLVI